MLIPSLPFLFEDIDSEQLQSLPDPHKKATSANMNSTSANTNSMTTNKKSTSANKISTSANKARRQQINVARRKINMLSASSLSISVTDSVPYNTPAMQSQTLSLTNNFIELTDRLELAAAAALSLASSAFGHSAPLNFILPTSTTPINKP